MAFIKLLPSERSFDITLTTFEPWFQVQILTKCSTRLNHFIINKLIQKIYSRESVTTIHNGITYCNIKAYIEAWKRHTNIIKVNPIHKQLFLKVMIPSSDPLIAYQSFPCSQIKFTIVQKIIHNYSQSINDQYSFSSSIPGIILNATHDKPKTGEMASFLDRVWVRD